MTPSYKKLKKQELKKRVNQAWAMLTSCNICPRNCKVNRIKHEKGGICEMGATPVIRSYHAHFGEEKPLVGTYGSGTIFFSS